MPKRIQRKRTKGWKMPDNTIYVGRPSKWGNPFTGKDAVEKYKKLIEFFRKSEIPFWTRIEGVHIYSGDFTDEGLAELKGKDLACWCPLDKPCHADILLQLANGLSV